jgi:hypothetical protein
LAIAAIAAIKTVSGNLKIKPHNMFKKKTLNSQQLGLLTSALMKNLFPKPIKGELLVEENASNGGQCVLYFKNDYHKRLFGKIADQVNTGAYARSNAEGDWMNLAEAIRSATEIGNIDTSKFRPHFLYIDEATEPIVNNTSGAGGTKRIKIEGKIKFLPTLPFGMEILDSLWKEILQLDGGTYSETGSTLKFTTTANKSIVGYKNKIEENNNEKTIYQGSLEDICSKKITVTYHKEKKHFEIRDGYNSESSFRVIFSLN